MLESPISSDIHVEPIFVLRVKIVIPFDKFLTTLGVKRRPNQTNLNDPYGLKQCFVDCLDNHNA